VPYSVGFTYPRPPVGPWGLIVNLPTVSYKRLGWTPLPGGQKKERLRQERLEHNTTQFSHERRVLRLGNPNHLNDHVHCVHLELTTKRLKAFPAKEPQRAALERLWWKCHKTTLTPTKCQLQAGSLSTAFLTSLAFASFLSEAKQTFTNFPTAHHNLESSRAMPSHLGGFTSKSNKCHKDCFIKLKCSSAHKEDLTQPLAWTSHKSLKPHLEVKGRCLKGIRKSIFISGTSSPQWRGWGSFYTIRQKLVVGN
jgi:hypothetical protein